MALSLLYKIIRRIHLRFTVTIFFVLRFSSLRLVSSDASAQAITITEIANNLIRPIAIANAGDGSGRLFIVQQSGQILIYNGTQVLGTPFLDISALITCCGERGLLSAAFHPNYENNGFFYVFYTAASPNTGDLKIDRFTVSANPNIANPMSRQPVISIDHSEVSGIITAASLCLVRMECFMPQLAMVEEVGIRMRMDKTSIHFLEKFCA